MKKLSLSFFLIISIILLYIAYDLRSIYLAGIVCIGLIVIIFDYIYNKYKEVSATNTISTMVNRSPYLYLFTLNYKKKNINFHGKTINGVSSMSLYDFARNVLLIDTNDTETIAAVIGKLDYNTHKSNARILLKIIKKSKNEVFGFIEFFNL